ncbi:macro domain-containing protein [Arthrospira platensis SPKY2]
MNYREESGNLFEVDNKYSLVQCISLDCEMGEGIAVEFDKRFKPMKRYLKTVIRNNNLKHPVTISYKVSDNVYVYNLITKKRYWNKPTYMAIEECIKQMAQFCKNSNIKYLAMPKIGSGLDKLMWGKVRGLVKQYFNDMNIEILVIRKKRR